MLDEVEPPPEIPEHRRFEHDAFWRLDLDRPILILPVTINAAMAGSASQVQRIPRRIPFRDIREFASAYGIVGQRFVEFRYLIEAMDGEALITRAEMQGQIAPAADEQSDE